MSSLSLRHNSAIGESVYESIAARAVSALNYAPL